jgi:hypothetical protein
MNAKPGEFEPKPMLVSIIFIRKYIRAPDATFLKPDQV